MKRLVIQLVQALLAAALFSFPMAYFFWSMKP
jgi:hypothetical protein